MNYATQPDPFIGRWTSAELAAAKTAFDAADLTDVDPEMAETLRQLQNWVAAAMKMPRASIVGFLS